MAARWVGVEAARHFFDAERFVLDGAAAPSERRRDLRRELASAASVARLAALASSEWDAALRRWTRSGPIDLEAEARRVHARAACAWSDVGLAEVEAELRSRDLSPAGRARPFAALAARRRCERWLRQRIDDVRAGAGVIDRAAALARIACHRDEHGKLLAERVAAVELLNLLRSIVAAAADVVAVAHALLVQPEWRQRLAHGLAALDDAFVQEVRRTATRVPTVGARVRHEFEWNGLRVPRGRRVLLDLHGTNRDPRTWSEPDRFRPERFLPPAPEPPAFGPHGAGDAATLELAKVALDFLVRRIDYDAPEPSRTQHRFVLERVRERLAAPSLARSAMA